MSLTGAEKTKFEKQFVLKLLTPEQTENWRKATETEVKAQEEPEAEEVEETTENNEAGKFRSTAWKAFRKRFQGDLGCLWR